MKDCKECGKKLGIFGGYIHPTLGKNYLLCNRCFDQVSDSVEKWKEFVLSNSFNNNASKSPNLDKSVIKKADEIKSSLLEKMINFTKSQGGLP
jgi:hypothetical protein